MYHEAELTVNESEFDKSYLEKIPDDAAAVLVNDDDDDDEDDGWTEKIDGEDPSDVGNTDTLLLNDSHDIQNITTALNSFSIAPGENMIPLPMTLDEHALRAAYPTLFAGQLQKKDFVPITVADMAKLFMEHKDNCFRLHSDFLFAQYRNVQTHRLKNSVSINLRKNKCLDGTSIKAKDIMGTSANSLIQYNGGYKVLTPDRSSPPFWEKVKSELMAMVRQLGTPTFFLTFSAAEDLWPEVIKSLYFDKYGKQLTMAEVTSMSWLEKVTLIRENPVLTSRLFDNRFRVFFNTVLKPTLGYNDDTDDYFLRVEFQCRGSPHAHVIVWLESAPKYGRDDKQTICNFIDKFITVELPGECLSDIPPYLKCQIHRHTMTCKKQHRKKCRFGYPRKPFPKTMILEPLDFVNHIKKSALQNDLPVENIENEKKDLQKKLRADLKRINTFLSSLDLSDSNTFNMTFHDFLNKIEMTESEYYLTISSSLKRPQIFLKREVKSIRTNNYNETLLKVWVGNLDIQFILDPYSVCQYVVNYIGKSYRGMSKLLRKVSKECKQKNVCMRDQLFKVCREFQGASEISSQEVGFHLMQMPLTTSSRTKVRINTYPPEERVKMLKSSKNLADLPPDSEDIFVHNSLDSYALRDATYENVNLIDFVSGRLTEKRTKVVLYYYYDKVTQLEEFSRVQLLLFVPWRDESRLKVDFETHADRYLSMETEIEKIRSHYHRIENKVVEDAMEQCEDEFGMVPIVDEEERAAKIVNDNQNSSKFDNFIPADMSNELGFDYLKEEEFVVKKSKINKNEMNELFRNLNVKQKEIFYEIIHREEKKIPYHFVIIGKAGTGKSKVLKAINTYIDHFYSNMRGNDPNLAYSIIAAYTGNAAFNAGGHTFHSSLGIRAMKGFDSSNNGFIPDKTLNHLMNVFSKIVHLSGDEFTYIGSSMLAKINRHLKLIKGNPRDDFGGLNIVFYGDPCQLGPIADRYIFESNSKDPYGDISGGSLFEKFQTFELTEIMRQSNTDFQNALCDLADASAPMSAKNVNLFKSRERHENELNIIDHDKRVDLFSENKDVNALNERMIAQVNGHGYAFMAEISMMGDEPRSVKEKVKQAIFDRKDHTQTVGLRLNVVFKIDARFFIPVNVDLNDGLVNGAIGMLKHIDTDVKGVPVTLWMKFDHENVGINWRQLLMKCGPCIDKIERGLTPIWKIAKNFPTSRKRLTGRIVQFPLYLAYGFTICKAQGNNHIGIHTIVHLNKNKKVPRKQLYVALSRTDILDNLIIIGNFEDPWFREEEARKKVKGLTRQDEIIAGYANLLSKKITMSWTPLYAVKQNNNIVFTFFNVNSLRCHIEDVRHDFSILSSDLIFFYDTRLKQSETPFLSGFNVNATLSMGKQICVPGGLALYTKDGFETCLIHEINVVKEGFFCQVLICSLKSCNLIGLYFSPKCPNKYKQSSLAQAINCISDFEKTTIIGGDFNSEDDFSFLINKGFVRLPLDCTTKYGSNIDQVYVKTSKAHHFGCNPCYYSDHKSVFLVLESEDVKNCSKEKIPSAVEESSTSDLIKYANQLNHSEKTKKRGQIRIIDRLNTMCSNELISFAKSQNYEVFNSNGKDQKGLSCGYLCAKIVSRFFSLTEHQTEEWLLSDIADCFYPDIALFNQVLAINGNEAQELDSTQIMKLVSNMTNDNNLNWLFLVDINLFRRMLKQGFSNISFPSFNRKKYACFCINDAKLSDKERQINLQSGNNSGNH